MARLLKSKRSNNLMDPFQFQEKYQQVDEQQQNEEEEQRGILDNPLSKTKKVAKDGSVIMPPADRTFTDFEQTSSELTNVNDSKEDIWAQKRWVDMFCLTTILIVKTLVVLQIFFRLHGMSSFDFYMTNICALIQLMLGLASAFTLWKEYERPFVHNIFVCFYASCGLDILFFYIFKWRKLT
ncbi:hypothetical protein NCAS_0H00140 [Naumovozyma castellii]|uniref:Uncharacterized protein n=1 Tax=Naumovozyma castellii TaxID=27288 RepID=G0VIJ9_NAUCA|nr:hypothetical protein NCAS_0H00140 [Naumovozyma castellii CBS 4309]CCC71324.1 hypothetical protein NCAS_0H00140 [Naumovozyma castellii CBS 4309]